MRLFLWLVVHCCLLVNLTDAAVAVAAVDEGDAIVLSPITGRPKKNERALLIIPGGLVPHHHYVKLAESVQRHASTDLWVGIVSCHWTAGLCNPLDRGPLGLPARIEATKKSMAKKAGFKFESSDYFVAGHSLGGQGAVGYANENPEVKGVLLWASYLINDLDSYQFPVLSLGAELDTTQAGPLRFAGFYRQFEEFAQAKGLRKALSEKPVLLLPGLNHIDFSPGYIREGEIESEVSPAHALEVIGRASASFIDLQVPSTQTIHDAKFDILERMNSATHELLSPLNKLEQLEKDGRWCDEAQRSQAASIDVSDVTFSSKVASSVGEFVFQHPSIERSAEKFEIQSYSLAKPPRDFLGSAMNFSSREIACKMNSAEKITAAAERGVIEAAPNCAEMNRRAFDLALQAAAPSTRDRFLASQWNVDFEDDEPCQSGPDFVFAKHIKLKETDHSFKIASPFLKTDLDSPIYPGSYYCKLLSPMRALEWLMSDGLR